MRKRESLVFAAVLVVAAAAAPFGCAAVPAATDTLTVTGPSLADFSSSTGGVSAVFERNCGSIDCHGNEYEPLRIYSQYGLRLPPNVSTVNAPMDSGATDGGAAEAEVVDAGPPLPAPPPNVPGGVPTTPEEVLANYESIISLEPRTMQAVVKGGDPYSLLLLKKPLLIEPHKGGPALHKGGDAENCIVSWLKGMTDTASCTSGAKLP